MGQLKAPCNSDTAIAYLGFSQSSFSLPQELAVLPEMRELQEYIKCPEADGKTGDNTSIQVDCSVLRV